MVDGHLIFNYNQINESIFLGSNQCCFFHFDKELLQKGVTCDISMESERMDSPIGVDYFVWLPTVDHTAPSLRRLSLGVSVMKNVISGGEKVYVHCKNGHGRAPSLVAAYFISEFGMSVSESIEYIRERRREVHFEDVQIARLEEFYSIVVSD